MYVEKWRLVDFSKVEKYRKVDKQTTRKPYKKTLLDNYRQA